MDLLKRELQRKRQMLESDFGGRKLLKRSEIERKEIQKLREEEHRRLRSKSPSAISSCPQVSIYEDVKKPEDLALRREEVIRRLRLLKQPVTLFGEDDVARLRRLQSVIESGPIEIDAEMTEGQTNDFLRDIYELRKNYSVSTKGKISASGDGEDKEVSGDGAAGMEGDKDAKRMKAEFEELCDEDKILVFFKRLLNEWNQEVEEMPEKEKRTAKGKATVATYKQCARYLEPLFKMEMPEKEKRTAKGKATVATYKQCARYLEPLFKMCRKKTLSDDIRQALLVVVKCCRNRDYLTAMDQYIKLAIGNAPWPIGLTMVGIHERSAREKIYTNSVAHIMNDETTRKYLQSVKRLMTFCQRRYPADPSRSVEFNSLANGSDLQSFLAEQRSKMSNSQERLQLVQAN